MIENNNDVDAYLKKKADRINDITRSISENYVELGRHLYDVKETLGHGKWGAWILENCNFSQKNAEQIMKYYLLSLGHPEFMHFKKCVIYELGSDGYPKALKEQLSLYMKNNHYDLSLKNALALRKNYLNGKIELNSPSIIKYLTKMRNTYQVSRLKIEGERVDKIVQREIKNIDKLLTIKIDIDGNAEEQSIYRKKLKMILDQASIDIKDLNKTFDIIYIDRTSIEYTGIDCSFSILPQFFQYCKAYKTSTMSYFEGKSHFQPAYKLESINPIQQSSWCELISKVGGVYNA